MYIVGTNWSEFLPGTDFADTIDAFGGDDTLFGYDGDDLLGGGYGVNYIHGGFGYDIVSYSFTSGVYVDLNQQGAESFEALDTLISVEGIIGSLSGDTLIGDSQPNTFFGNNGNDSLSGDAGDDLLIGGYGSDIYRGGSGADVFGYGAALEVAGDTIVDFTGEDILLLGVRLHPNFYQEQLFVQPISGGVNLGIDTDANGTFETVVTLLGSFTRPFRAIPGTSGSSSTAIIIAPAPTAGADFVFGMANNDSLDGLGGDDAVLGYSGNDTVRGGAGDDVVTGGNGNDIVDGGTGDDVMTGGFGLDRLTPGEGADLLLGIPEEHSGDTIEGFGAGDKIGVADFLFFQDQMFFDAATGRLSIDANSDGVRETVINLTGPQTGFVASQFTSETGLNMTYIVRQGPAGSGNDSLVGIASADSFNGGEGDDALYGFAGNDTLSGGTGSDALQGGTGNDILVGGDGDDFLFGELGSDRITSGAGRDVIAGLAAELNGDTITDLTSIDAIQLFGVNFAAGAIARTAIAGGTRLDIDTDGNGAVDTRITLQGITSGSFDAASQNDVNGVSTAIFYRPLPTTSNDTLFGTSATDTISALAGDDLVFAGTGNDSVNGGLGNDGLYGDTGNDTLDGSDGADVLIGGAGADRCIGGAGDDVFLGSLADLNGDTLSLLSSTDIILVDAVRFDERSLTITAITGGTRLQIDSNLDGTADASITIQGIAAGTLTAESNPEGDGDPSTIIRLFSSGTAGAGNDTLLGTAAAQTLNGLAGNDLVLAQGGNDSLVGGLGNDTLSGGLGDDTADGGGGIDLIRLGDGNDRWIATGGGNDTVYGEEGNDRLAGGSGAESIFGGSGADTMSGGAGNDTVTGGAGSDVFALTLGGGNDSIIDFADGVDLLDLSAFAVAIGGVSISAVAGGTRVAVGDTSVLLEGISVGAVTAADLFGLRATPTTGNDTLFGTSGNDTVDALAGDDSLFGLAGNDSLQGNAGRDTRGGRLRLDSFSLLISGRSAGCRCDVPYSGWHVGRA